jgi:hypothetical protein
MGKTNTGLVAFCEQALVAGTGYVYGTIGQVCTKSLLEQCAARYPADNLAGGPMRKLGEKWLGRRVTDCIGLLKYYIMSNGFGQDPHYNSKYDKSANGAYNDATEKGPISTLPEIPGICLHMPGHFGVYIGNGDVIEARGTAYGVVKTRLTQRPWTAWFKSPWLTYIQEQPQSIMTTSCDTSGTFDIFQGDSYQLKITSPVKPDFTVGNPNVARGEWVSQSGNDYFYKITAIGRVGEEVGLYLNGKRQCIARIISRLPLCDTTTPFTIRKGSTYQFKVTSAKEPVFIAGTPGVLDISLAKKDRTAFYYKAVAVGTPGTGTGIYINGTKVTVVTVV